MKRLMLRLRLAYMLAEMEVDIATAADLDRRVQRNLRIIAQIRIALI